MPRGDGTGPMGFGPMTGRGTGFCAGYSAPGFAGGFGGGGFGRGRGYFGRGGGRGWRNRRYATGLYGWQRDGMGMPVYDGTYAGQADPVREAAFLKEEAESLKRRLDEIQLRIVSFEKGREKTEE